MASINHSNNLCFVTLLFPSSTSADSDKLQSMLEALKKVEELCDFHENLKNAKDEPKNLLENLCDGLQTFLGFNSTTKGYDGTGIVYSDLDRLCDGVMAFLKGVLGAVKDENAVKKYREFNEVTDYLQKSIGKGYGIEGLQQALGVVKEGLMWYEERIKTVTENVTNDLSGLTKRLDAEYKNEIKDTDNLSTQLSTWTETLGKIEQEVKDIEDEKVDKLDTALKLKVFSELKPIRSVLEHLKNSSENDALVKQTERVDETLEIENLRLHSKIEKETERVQNELEKQKTNLLKKVNTEFPELRRTVSKSFQNMSQQIGRIADITDEEFSKIRDAMNKAHELISFSISHVDIKYRTPMLHTFDEVKELLRTVDPKNTKAGADDGKSKFRCAVDAIKVKVQEVDQLLKRYIQGLGECIKDAHGIINSAQEECIKNVNLANGGRGSLKQAIADAAGQITSETGTLHNQFTQLRDRYNEVVTTIKGRDGSGQEGVLGEINDASDLEEKLKLPSDMDGYQRDGWELKEIDVFKKKIVSDINTHVGNQIIKPIQMEVKIIKGPGNPGEKISGVQGIRERVKAYAKEYESFENKLQEWIKEILEYTNPKALVKKYIKDYVSAKHGSNIRLESPYDAHGGHVIRQDLIQNMARYIKEELKTKVIDQTNVKMQPAGTEIKANVEAVNKVCIQFADELEKKVNDRENEFVCGIAKAIARGLGAVDPKSQDCANSNLIGAVYLILHQVIGMSRNVATEILLFATKDYTLQSPPIHSIADNVTSALSKSAQLEQNLTKAHNTATNPVLHPGPFPANPIATAVNAIEGTVKQADNQLTALLTAAIKKAIGNLHRALSRSVVDTLNKVNNVDVTAFERAASVAKTSLESHASALSNKLNELTQTVSNISSDVHGKLYTLREETINKKLGAVKINTENLHSGNVKYIVEGIRGILVTIGELEMVPADIDGRKKEVEQMMHELTQQFKRIQTHLGMVASAVERAEVQLNHALEALNQALISTCNSVAGEIQCLQNDLTENTQNSFTTANEAARRLQEQLVDEVNKAFEAATLEIQKLYASGHRTDLESLNNMIKRKRNEIFKIITIDLKSGVKGLMMALNGHDDYSLKKMMMLVTPTKPHVGKSPAIFIELCKKLRDYLNYIFKYAKYGLHPADNEEEDADLVSHSQADSQRINAGYTARPVTTTSRSKGNPHGRVGMSGTAKPAEQQSPSEASRNHIADYIDRLSYYVDGIFGALSAGYYSIAFASKLKDFENVFTVMRPSTFAGLGSPLFDFLIYALQSMIQQLKFAYISAYDRAAYNFNWDIDGQKCAKLFLTITPIVFDSLTDLKTNLENADGKWATYGIYDSKNSHRSLHRLFFRDHGYDVGLSGNAPNGELNHTVGYNGARILSKLMDVTHHLFKSDSTRLTGDSKSAGDGDGLIVDLVDEGGVIPELHVYVHEYYQVGHITKLSKARSPCSVHDMLVWLDGLPHNPIYAKLADHIKSSCAKPEKYKSRKASEVDATELTLEKTSPLTARHLFDIILKLCANAHNLLTTIVGFGDEHSTYASDFANNALNFTYPSSGEDCIQTFLDILKRLFLPLRFMEGQCGHPSSIHGWANCDYGKDVDPSNWQCNDHSSNKPNGQPTDQQNSRANCRPTSPLMSYLTDCLPGHLPHHLKSIGCKTECDTCPKSTRGQPCLTPLGFRCFSGSMKTGKQLCRVLSKFFDNVNVSCLFTLGARPPSTLPEHFEFLLSLVKGWHTTSAKLVDGAFQRMFDSSITELSIGLYDPPSNLTDALRNAYGSTQNGHPQAEVKRADLSSLSTTSTNAKQPAYCAPYLHSLCHDSYSHLARKHANLYLSWAVYLPWDFYACLSNLLQALKDIFCQDWGCRSCMPGDKCKKGSHAVIDSTCQCTSVVACRGVSPTLYRFGFRFGVPWLLADKNSPKTCFEFQTQLANVLNSDCMQELFKQCDEFIFSIRAPFLWLNIALWSLSLFYLICVMVGRLDVLHIRSHLRIPSSHKITAQSLLAAAQVGRLAKISYLQP